MTRAQYSSVLPVLVFSLVTAGFILGIIFPDLTTTFYLVFDLVGGALIMLVYLSIRKRVDEPLTDERIEWIAQKATWMTFRYALPPLIIVAFIPMFAFPAIEPLRFIGIGVACTVGLLSLVYFISFTIVRRRS